MPSENSTTAMGMETFMKFIHAIQKVHKGIFLTKHFYYLQYGMLYLKCMNIFSKSGRLGFCNIIWFLVVKM